MAELGLRNAFACPELPPSPRAAVALLERQVRDAGLARTALVGSSLGGYYATHLAERLGVRAVLLNPAVRPYALLQGHVGPQTNLYSGERYEFTMAHVGELRALETAAITPGHYLLIVTTGDEVLDYRDAVARYRGCRQVVIDGGDHGLSSFGDHIETVLEFCGFG